MDGTGTFVSVMAAGEVTVSPTIWRSPTTQSRLLTHFLLMSLLGSKKSLCDSRYMDMENRHTNETESWVECVTLMDLKHCHCYFFLFFPLLLN